MEARQEQPEETEKEWISSDILQNIFSFLPIPELFKIRATCKSFYLMLSHPDESGAVISLEEYKKYADYVYNISMIIWKVACFNETSHFFFVPYSAEVPAFQSNQIFDPKFMKSLAKDNQSTPFLDIPFISWKNLAKSIIMYKKVQIPEIRKSFQSIFENKTNEPPKTAYLLPANLLEPSKQDDDEEAEKNEAEDEETFFKNTLICKPLLDSSRDERNQTLLETRRYGISDGSSFWSSTGSEDQNANEFAYFNLIPSHEKPKDEDEDEDEDSKKYYLMIVDIFLLKAFLAKWQDSNIYAPQKIQLSFAKNVTKKTQKDLEIEKSEEKITKVLEETKKDEKETKKIDKKQDIESENEEEDQEDEESEPQSEEEEDQEEEQIDEIREEEVTISNYEAKNLFYKPKKPKKQNTATNTENSLKLDQEFAKFSKRKEFFLRKFQETKFFETDVLEVKHSNDVQTFDMGFVAFLVEKDPNSSTSSGPKNNPPGGLSQEALDRDLANFSQLVAGVYRSMGLSDTEISRVLEYHRQQAKTRQEFLKVQQAFNEKTNGEVNLKVNFIGKVEKQPTDSLYYTCIDVLDLKGKIIPI